MSQEAEAASWYKTSQSDGTQLKLSLHSTYMNIQPVTPVWAFFQSRGRWSVFPLSLTQILFASKSTHGLNHVV